MRALPALAQPHRIRDDVRRLGDPFEVANSLDCLILIDLRKSEPRVLRKCRRGCDFSSGPGRAARDVSGIPGGRG